MEEKDDSCEVPNLESIKEEEKPTRTVFIDYVSGKPVDERVLEAMQPYHREIFGNPSSLHIFGDPPVEAMEDARKRLPT